jgi:hypothetical protein
VAVAVWAWQLLASHTWVVCQLKILVPGRRLLRKRGSCRCERHARKLQRLHVKINAEATAIAGAASQSIIRLGSVNTNPLQLRVSMSTMRAAALWKALESSMSLIWPTPRPIAPITWPRAECRQRLRLNELL